VGPVELDVARCPDSSRRDLQPRCRSRLDQREPDQEARSWGATDRWRPLFVAAAHRGTRISELLALQWSDIDWKDDTPSITKQLGRDGKFVPAESERGARKITLSAELRRVLREHWVASGQLQGFVFACESGRAPSYRNARKAFDRAVNIAKIQYDKETHRVGFHGFRHGAVSALIRSGADPVRIAAFVGDKIETVLSTYAQEWATAKDDNLGDVLAAALSTG
jgi:integrase